MLGWLSHRPIGADGKPASLSRGEQLQADGVHVELPTAPAYLLDWMEEVGWFSTGPAGPVALPATEVAAWAAGTRRRLQGWEFSALQAASRAFVFHLRDESPVPPDGEPIKKPSLLGKFKQLAQQINKTPT